MSTAVWTWDGTTWSISIASGVLISLGLEADKAWCLGQRDWEDTTFAICTIGTLALRLLLACT